MTISTQSFLAVNPGSTANDGTGDSLRNAFIKVNANFGYMGNVGFDAANINVSGSLVLANVYVPTLANSTGTAGQVAYDTDFVYICVAADTWKRANLAAW